MAGLSKGARPGQRGFTLLEVMLAAVLFAIAGTGIYASYAAVLDVAAEAREGSRLAQTGRLVLERMADDLRCAHQPADAGSGDAFIFRIGGEAAEEEPDQSRDPDLERARYTGITLMELVSAESLVFGAGFPEDRLTRVQYVLRRADDAPESSGVLVRRWRAVFSTAPEGEWTEVRMSAAVRELEIAALDAQGNAAQVWRMDDPERPDSTWPRRVRLRLVLARDGIERESAMQVDMLAALREP